MRPVVVIVVASWALAFLLALTPLRLRWILLIPLGLSIWGSVVAVHEHVLAVQTRGEDQTGLAIIVWGALATVAVVCIVGGRLLRQAGLYLLRKTGAD